MKSETSLQQSETPKQCTKGCGFFGTAATLNMCSKCYRDSLLNQHQSDAVTTAVEKSMNLLSLSNNVVEEKEKQKHKSAVPEVASSKTPSTNSRCGCCNKKVSMVGFNCKCGSTFCGAHRYPEEHNCTFDFKLVGKQALFKANPLIIADKLQKI